MRFISSVFVVLLTVAGTPAMAADNNGNYAVWGMGNSSCHGYNKAREKGETDGFRYYVMGYLTAYNVHQSETYSISSTQPMPEIMAWFDDFCGDNAVHSFESALKNYIHEHYKERMKAKPASYAR